MKTITKDPCNREQNRRLFKSDPPVRKETVNDCWICFKLLEKIQEKILEHCLYSGKFLGWAHSKNNQKTKTINLTPVNAHNMTVYDIHQICTKINRSTSKNTFSVIPKTDVRYIFFTFCVWVDSFVDKNGVTKNVQEDMRFLDTFKLLPQFLEKLGSCQPK